MRVTARLVHVEVEGDEQLELGQARLERVTVGRAHDRVARGDDGRPHLVRAGCPDLLGQHPGQEATDVAQPPDARPVGAERVGAHACREPRHVDRVIAEDQSTGSVEVAGHDGERVGEERGESAGRVASEPDAGLSDGALGHGEVDREPPDDVGLDACDRSRAVRE